MLRFVNPLSKRSAAQCALLRKLLLTFFLFFVVSHSFAQEISEQQAMSAELIETLRAQVHVYIAAGQIESALAIVNAHEANGSGDPDYDYLLGTTALAAGKNTLAVHVLERVVLVQPSYVGAWLDLAIAHFRIGEIEIADGLLQHVEDNFNPSPPIRAEIAEVRRGFTKARLVKGWQAELGAFAGRTSNANFGLAVSKLDLTLGGSNVSLLLDPSYASRSDGFKEYRTSLTRGFVHAEGAHAEVYGGLRFRSLNAESDQDQRDFIIAGSWRKPVAWSALQGMIWLAGASVRNLTYPGRSVNVGQLSVGLGMPLGRCRLSGKLDYEQRLYSGEGTYDAAIPWVGAGLECTEGNLIYGT